MPVKSVDATGAEDAFAAALTVRMAEGCSLQEAGAAANAAAALTTTALGAQASLPRRCACALAQARTASCGDTTIRGGLRSRMHDVPRIV